MFLRILGALVVAGLVGCNNLSAPQVNVSEPQVNQTVEISSDRLVRGISAVVQYDSSAYAFTGLEASQGVLTAKKVETGQLKLGLMRSQPMQGTWGTLTFKTLKTTTQKPQIRYLEVVEANRKTTTLVNTLGRSLARPQDASQFEAWFATVPLGDFDQSGIIDVTDAVNTLSISIGELIPTDFQSYIADLNGDGQVGLADAVALLDKSLDPSLLGQPVVKNASGTITVATGGTWVVGIGNSGNQALPSLSFTLPDGVTVATQSILSGQAAILTFSFASNAENGTIGLQFTGLPQIQLTYQIADSTPPEIQLGSIPQTVNASGSISLQFSVTDNRSVAEVKLYRGTELLQSFTPASAYSYSYTATPRQNGNQAFRVEARDNNNNLSSSSFNLEVDIGAYLLDSNCGQTSVGGTCTVNVMRTGTTPNWKGFGFDLVVGDFAVVSTTVRSGCTSNHAQTAQAWRFGAFCDTASNDTALMQITLTRTSQNGTTFMLDRAILATAQIPSVSWYLEGDSFEVGGEQP
jgi:hypothetical protein